jgi:hypothetical protein
MAKIVKIRFPEKNGDTLEWPKEPGSFVAFGAAKEVTKIEGKITFTDGTIKPIEGTPLRQPTKKMWILLFDGIPFGKEFALLVWDKDDSSKNDKRERLTLKKGARALDIFYPSAGAIVCPDFVAYGPNDEAGPVICKLEKTGQEDVVGTPIQNGPVWVQMFSRVFKDTYDDIRVTCVSSVPHATIKVDDAGGMCAEL